MALETYNKKRNFTDTPEPKGKQGTRKSSANYKNRFVVQRHDASRLHFDFRLELDRVLKSWAVPKGPSMNPTDKRLAVEVEDHPVGYIDFEGIIPEGNYGAGEVEVWDNGNYIPVNEEEQPISEKEAIQNLGKGELKFVLNGKKLKGGFVLVKMKGRGDKNWLLIKHKDDFASDKVFDPDKGRKGKGHPDSNRKAKGKQQAAKKKSPK